MTMNDHLITPFENLGMVSDTHFLINWLIIRHAN